MIDRAPLLAQDAEDDVPGLLAGAGPVDLGPAGFEFRSERIEMGVEVIDCLPLALGGGLAGALPVLE